MAELYLARTTHGDGRTDVVVLKRILPHLAEDPEFVRMFRDEAFLAATLDHPNIVRVHDIGQDGDDYFFTMEYVHGENVRTIIKAAQQHETTLPLQHVVEMTRGVCEGLHYAHERTDEQGNPLRIVHRDVSPTNILVSFDGLVKIVDFGIAKAAAATHVTQAGMLKGKASYMSPEQCRAQPVDRRSDVFAIGILLYEMTTLTRLFRGDNELAVLHQILTGNIEAPSTRVDQYDPELERIVMRALAEKPDDRYPTALAMLEDLRGFARLRGLSSSTDALGGFLRELCGERPHPWDDAEAEGLEAVDRSATGTGMPTSLGNFEDEEDTQVNRRAPQLRTLVPGAPSEWTSDAAPDAAPEEGEEITGATNRRESPLPGALPKLPPKVGAPPATGPRKPLGTRPGPRSAARGLLSHRPRLPGAPRGMGIPSATADADLGEFEAVELQDRNDPQAETTTPMAKRSVV
ncbi:MAG: serine/threonine protein kinase, partial [Myxococcales bacterium]|nr:serine/threonine protein kinase [Myxococcales bacterium]